MLDLRGFTDVDGDAGGGVGAVGEVDFAFDGVDC